MTSQQRSANGASSKLWGGRFTGMAISIKLLQLLLSNAVSSGATDPLMEAYNESLSFDRAFFAQDIAGSIAFARANVATGILTQTEFATIEKGLRQVLEEWKTDKFVIIPYPHRE
jgi:argininosuccinate lyase